MWGREIPSLFSRLSPNETPDLIWALSKFEQSYIPNLILGGTIEARSLPFTNYPCSTYEYTSKCVLDKDWINLFWLTNQVLQYICGLFFQHDKRTRAVWYDSIQVAFDFKMSSWWNDTEKHSWFPSFFLFFISAPFLSEMSILLIRSETKWIGCSVKAWPKEISVYSRLRSISWLRKDPQRPKDETSACSIPWSNLIFEREPNDWYLAGQKGSMSGFHHFRVKKPNWWRVLLGMWTKSNSSIVPHIGGFHRAEM